MNTLIFYAHPSTKGHCSAILEEVKKQLSDRNESYELFDLYEMKYDPILHEDEHYTSGGRTVTEENKMFQDKITAVANLIYIYPVWWGTMPAILKGFFDRVFISHYAFRYMPNGIPVGLLKGKKSIVFTTSGSPNFVTKLILGNRPSKIITRDILGFCGIKTRCLQLGSSQKFEDSKMPKIKEMVRKGLAWLY